MRSDALLILSALRGRQVSHGGSESGEALRISQLASASHHRSRRRLSLLLNAWRQITGFRAQLMGAIDTSRIWRARLGRRQRRPNDQSGAVWRLHLPTGRDFPRRHHCGDSGDDRGAPLGYDRQGIVVAPVGDRPPHAVAKSAGQ